jgi:hypothetical protein
VVRGVDHFQRGVGLTCGPLACIDHSVFSDLGVATLAGALPWELGTVSRDEGLRGAAGRAFPDAYRRQCSEAVG